jgi:hypothetical protein
MARRSILSSVREQQAGKAEPEPVPAATAAEPEAAKIKPSRRLKKHIGGYYAPNDPVIIAFQKLGIDIDTDQQEMLYEAIRDYVAKHQAASAFSKEPQLP